MKKIIAADAKLCVRGKFRAPFGVVVTFNSPNKFKGEYKKLIETLHSENGMPQVRHVLKSYDLSILKDVSDPESYSKILGEIVDFLKTQNIVIDIVYSTFNPELAKEIKLYGVGSPINRVPLSIFINKLTHYYPHIAIWKLSQTRDISKSEILMDSFEGQVTGAWKDIEKLNVNIVPSGDQCSPYISISDILCKWLDVMLSNNKMRLHENDIDKLMRQTGFKNFNVHYCGHQDLWKIVPLYHKKIPLSAFYKRPLVFVMSECVMKNESNFLERSPLWNRVLNHAYSVDGGVKHFDYTQDDKFIQKGDHVLVVGETAKKKADYLKKIGLGIEVIDVEDLEDING